jgi:bacteriorhodopsin
MLTTMLAAAPEACTQIEIIGSTGVGALTITFLALLITTIMMAFVSMSWGEKQKSVFLFINTFIVGVSALAYFAMLSDQGWTAIAGCRQFFYARYLDAFITHPLIILSLGLVAGVDRVTIAAVAGADVGSILCAYMGAISVVPTVKWFWFVFSLALLVPVLYALASTFRACVQHAGAESISELYNRSSWLIVVSWCFYPIVWLFSEGFASFSVSFEVIAYAILDLLVKVAFTVIIAKDKAVLNTLVERLEYV